MRQSRRLRHARSVADKSGWDRHVTVSDMAQYLRCELSLSEADDSSLPTCSPGDEDPWDKKRGVRAIHVMSDSAANPGNRLTENGFRAASESRGQAGRKWRGIFFLPLALAGFLVTVSCSGSDAGAAEPVVASTTVDGNVKRSFHYVSPDGWEYDITMTIPAQPISVTADVTQSPPGKAQLAATATDFEYEFTGTVEGRDAPDLHLDFLANYIWTGKSIGRFPSDGIDRDGFPSWDSEDCWVDEYSGSAAIYCDSDPIGPGHDGWLSLAEVPEDHADAVADFIKAHPTPNAISLETDNMDCRLIVPLSASEPVHISPRPRALPEYAKACESASATALG